MKERGDEIEVLGFSQFVSTEQLNIYAKDLADFAKSIGADYVVVSSYYGGKTTNTIDRPYTSYSYVTGGGYRHRAGIVTASTTTAVPVNVIEDQFFYSAAFLRKTQR